jgi:hypothetical protein
LGGRCGSSGKWREKLKSGFLKSSINAPKTAFFAVKRAQIERFCSNIALMHIIGENTEYVY